MQWNTRFIGQLSEGVAVLQKWLLFFEMPFDRFINFGDSCFSKEEGNGGLFFFFMRFNHHAVPNPDIGSHLEIVFPAFENFPILFLKHYQGEIQVNAGKEINEKQIARQQNIFIRCDW